MDDIAAFLHATAPFDLLDPGVLNDVAARADVVRAEAGETVLDPRAGEPSRHAFVVREGEIEHVWYPVFPPDRHAEEVVGWLRATPAG